MSLPQSYIICDKGHRGTVDEDTLHKKPDPPDLMRKEHSIRDSRNSEHSGPNIAFDRCEQLCSQHSHGVFEALVLKIIVELVTAKSKKSPIVSGSRFCSCSCRCIAVSIIKGVIFPNMLRVRASICSIADHLVMQGSWYFRVHSSSCKLWKNKLVFRFLV